MDDLYCEILVKSVDPDNNSVTYTFDWTVDGSIYNGIPTTIAYSGDTFHALETNAGEFWACTVTPNDGTEDESACNGSEIISDGMSNPLLRD